ncbi:MAG: DUF531 domain-containing protein [Thermoplasmata archaeon]|nr:DUF531 domain-containing protein [Thermoplasmata archaeon]
MRLGRMTLGLYNSYDPKKIREAHRRALARAGPVAMAFDCNLVTFGFPYDRDMRTPAEIVEWISETTSIGNGGQYLIELAQAGRFQAFDMPKKGFPPQFGKVIITTSKPDPKKSITPKQLADMVSGGGSVLLLIGLGPHGLPKKVFGVGEYHLDITGKGMSLETCTAMGIIPAVLSTMNHKL